MNPKLGNMGNLWHKIEDYVAAIMLFVMILLIVLQVVFRYVIHISPIGAEEMARYLMIWVVFLAAGIGVRTREHITIDILPMFLKNEKVLKAMRLFLDVVTLVVVGVFFILSIRYLSYNLSSGERSVALRFPMWIPTSCVFVGSFLMVVYGVTCLIEDIKGIQTWK